MRLDYKLLWIEDEIDWVDTYQDTFYDYLLDFGFKLNTERLTKAPTPTELAELGIEKFHLILMDYNLGSGDSGQDVIQAIRGAGEVTEIIFYSSDPNLVEKIHGLALEGVYWARRDDEDFEQRVKKIIDLTIRRVMDLPAMRGLAIAEIADIDFMMNKIIEKHHNGIDNGSQEELRKDIYKRIKSSVEDLAKKICQKEAECLTDLAFVLNKNGFIDSNKKWRTICGFAKNCGLDAKIYRILQNFDETLKKRNDLAHGYTQTVEGHERIIGRNQNYSLQDAIEIRKNLLEHRDNFDSIFQFLNT
jgi:CheY-like chemotaxis protein